MFSWGSKPGKSETTLPTVRFDRSRVTEAVKADLWATIQEFNDLPYGEELAVYEAALRSIIAGHSLNIICDALVAMGVDRGRSAEISRYLNSRASSLMDAERLLKLGFTESEWLYSGAACYPPGEPSDADRYRDAAHKKVSGKRYPTAKGMLINGHRTHPGRDPECKCIAGPVIPGMHK